MQPTDAIIAVTLNCNSRCVMCDIWRNEMSGEMRPEEYRHLPTSLKGINITGGEPFLRKDLPEIVNVIKKRCPKARLVISTHGFMPERIKELMPDILKIDPKIAVRISIDGLAKTHESVRGITGGFKRDMVSLEALRELGVIDLGIAMTVMDSNVEELPEVYHLSEELGVEFSVTMATDSKVYFGDDKDKLRPRNNDVLVEAFQTIIRSEYSYWQPKRWFRAWFEKSLLQYALGKGRPLACDAGKGFFYLDSQGRVYACHILPTLLGDLRTQSWEELWNSSQAEEVRERIHGCEQCWMVCTAKSEARRHLVQIGLEVLSDKSKTHLGFL
jgi:Fe-coproporphyrin III synthase